MIWTAAKVVLFAVWALVIAYMVVSLGDSLSPGTQVAPAVFGIAVLGIAALFFPFIWFAFVKVSPREYNGAELPDLGSLPDRYSVNGINLNCRCVLLPRKRESDDDLPSVNS